MLTKHILHYLFLIIQEIRTAAIDQIILTFLNRLGSPKYYFPKDSLLSCHKFRNLQYRNLMPHILIIKKILERSNKIWHVYWYGRMICGIHSQM